MASRKPDAASQLAENLLRQLAVQRGLGAGAYPLTVQHLAELTDPQALSGHILKAITKKPFLQRVVLAKKKTLAAPVALPEDRDQLAASPLLVEFALNQACSPAKPTVAVSRLKSKVEKSLQTAFVEALHEQIESSTLPPGIECVTVGKTKHLHLLQYPLPDPPEIKLAKDLVRILESQKPLGPPAYPATLTRLVELTALKATKALVAKATKADVFTRAAKPLTIKNSLIALAPDCEPLVGSAWFATFLIQLQRTQTNHALPLAHLIKPVAADLKALCTDKLQQQLESNTLPPGVGWLWIGRKKQLFLLDDVHRPGRAPAGAERPAAVTPATDFPQRFEEVFDRLDRAGLTKNFISLVELRRALTLEREAFDAGLNRLRAQGRFTLSAAEGRQGISAEERAAGILEHGTLLLYVSRRSP